MSHIDGELVEDTNGKWLWRTADGVLIPVEEMDDNHLRNAALFLLGFGFRRCIADNKVRVVWLRILRVEWARRMLQRTTEKKWRTNKELEEEKPNVQRLSRRNPVH